MHHSVLFYTGLKPTDNFPRLSPGPVSSFGAGSPTTKNPFATTSTVFGAEQKAAGPMSLANLTRLSPGPVSSIGAGSPTTKNPLPATANFHSDSIVTTVDPMSLDNLTRLSQGPVTANTAVATPGH